MTRTKIIEVDDILDAFDKVDLTQRNPQYDGGCVYTHPVTGCHCLAGEILLKLGVSLPDVDSHLNSVTTVDLLNSYVELDLEFDSTAARLLRAIQVEADQWHGRGIYEAAYDPDSAVTVRWDIAAQVIARQQAWLISGWEHV